jgi:hypothetical protein
MSSSGRAFSTLRMLGLALACVLLLVEAPAPAAAAENIEDAVLASLGMADNDALRHGLRSVRETVVSVVDYAKAQVGSVSAMGTQRETKKAASAASSAGSSAAASARDSAENMAASVSDAAKDAKKSIKDAVPEVDIKDL